MTTGDDVDVLIRGLTNQIRLAAHMLRKLVTVYLNNWMCAEQAKTATNADNNTNF